jgi:hypothetical protein
VKRVLILVFFSIPISLFAQKDSLGMPVLNGMVGIQKVVVLDSVTQKNVYSRAKLYFAETYKSAKDVIQLDDSEQGLIVGKAYTTGSYSVMLTIATLEVWFTLKIECKDSKYRYTLDNIKTTNNIPAESWWKYPNMNKKVRDCIGKSLSELCTNMESYMKKAIAKKDDKW